MKSVKKILKGHYWRKGIIYFLTCCLVLNTSLPAVLAMPSGGAFAPGYTGTIEYGVNTAVTVNQAQSVIEWGAPGSGGINTGATESLTFLQDGGLSNSAVLNRIMSGSPTQFNGTLNGLDMRIFIVNPAGVVFGSGSQVNVAQLVASGLGMTNTDFLNATGDPTQRMVFSGGSGDATNHGTITATNSVYLIGDDVTNYGAIRCPGGLVVMAAGSTLRLGQPGSSIIVDVSTDLVADFGNEVSNEGTVGQNGSRVGKLVLAAGDLFSQAITNVGDLAVVANEDVELDGNVNVTGSVEVLGGQDPLGSAIVNVGGHITAADIRLKNGADTSSGAVGEKSYSPIIVDDGKNLTATAGDIVVEAIHDIILGGNVQASGNIYLNADENGYGDPREPGYSEYSYGGGDLIARGTITAGGKVDIAGNAIRFEGNVTATGGDLTITGRTSRDLLEDRTLINDSIWGEIQAAEGITLSAGQNVSIIDGGGGPEDPWPVPETLLLTGETSLTIVAGTADGVDNGEIIVNNATIGVVGATSLTLEQDQDLDLGDEQWDLFNQSETDLTLISNNGSVTAVETGGNPENAADQWASVGATADTGITLSGDQGNITTKQLTSTTGDIDVNAKAAQLLATEAIEATAGSVNLTAADGIDADSDITAGTNISLNSSAEAAGDLLAGADVMINEDLTLNGGNWVLTDGVWSWQDGDQSIAAETGTITAESWIWKETPGELHMYGGSPELAIDLRYPGSLDEEDAAVATAGNLYIVGDGDVQISGDLTALGGDYWGGPDWPDTQEGETVIDPVAVGGVSIVSENGKIYTEDGVDNDMINIAIEGYSDQTEENIGIDLPYDDGKAAIVLMSNGDLKFGEDAELFAEGLYDATIVDDRAGVDFLVDSEDSVPPGRNPGDPIDVAIYLASAAGNVYVGSPVSIRSEGEGVGAMVVDAYDTVTFGSLFEDSLGGIGWLEVCSRRTGSLNEAAYLGTLPYADGSGPEEGYVLRGEKPDVGTGAWVLDAILPLALPDFAQTPKNTPIPGLDILSNDDAGEFLPVTVTLDSPTSAHGGTLTVNPDGTVTYEPPADLSGLTFDPSGRAIDTFTYRITDAGEVSSEPARVTITLTNNLPVPANDTATANQGASIVIDVLGNDSDPDADPLTVSSSFIYEGIGTVVLNEDGTFTYTPGSSFAGEDTFNYSVSDGFNSASGTVTITVNPVVVPPLAQMLSPLAPGLERVEFEISGCPALVSWAAQELGVSTGRIQIGIANALAGSRNIQPCDACAGLKQAAVILQDSDGTHIAALGQVINELASSTAPPTPEQMASIANAMALNVGGENQYAVAGAYIDALARYVAILNGEMGFSGNAAIQVAADNYVGPLGQGPNVGVAAYVAARLAILGGS